MPTSYDEEERIYHKGFRDGWVARDQSHDPYLRGAPPKLSSRKAQSSAKTSKPKRKASAYSKRYGAAFRKVAPKYKLKNGSWGKDGFKRCQKAAHKLARKD